ncbi:MAG: extracellular solute-binding protein [Clostridia bacterium]|nr:extracellular solute-binding protein [Clostridia bacterium]
MTRIFLKKTLALFCAMLAALLVFPLGTLAADDGETVLRVCSWEEYIDEGDWGEDEVIDLESGDIFGENHMVNDFENWYYDTYHKKVRVEYSTFGTNEDLYNMLTLGDVFDLVCPSEYMIMKLMAEDMLSPLSDEFFDESDENNYYIKGVSPYIRRMFETHEINGSTWDKYAAGFMWGVTGFVYNPEVVSREDASTWHLIDNTSYKRQITVKDNVRDTYFAALGALKSDLLTSDSFKNSPDYPARLQDEMNDTSPEMIAKVQDYLQSIKDNLYSFETDSGKADMITGKVVGNLQWSGDAVYSMDQAEEDDFILEFAVPEESTNVYFDGWVKLKNGVEGDPDKQHAAEAFINFLSRPDNVIRNMYYIGYTSVISNSEDGRVFEYLEWNYGADEDEEDTVEYPVGHFFSEDEESQDDFILTVPEDQLYRQLAAQYPSEDVLERASIMVYFNKEVSEATNQMWINIRCFNIKNVPVWCWILAGLIVALIAYAVIDKKISRKHQVSAPDITTFRKHERKN